MSNHSLGEFIDVDLGHKSLLHEFFHLTNETIDKYSIEASFLQPVFRKDDLSDTAFLQSGKPSVSLFMCDKSPADLRGTGAWKYITWAQRQEIKKPKKQSAAPMKWAEALKKQGGKYWYSPKAQPPFGKIALRKGIDKNYAPYIFSETVTLDQRLYVIAPKPGIPEALVIGYLASSLFALSLEVNADMALGDGVLTLGTKALRGLPCIDLAALAIDKKFMGALSAHVKAMLPKKPPTITSISTNGDVRRLDELFVSCLGLDPKRSMECSAEVGRLGAARIALARMRKTVKIAKEVVDVSAVTESFVSQLRPWVEARRFPEDSIRIDDATLQLHFPAGPLVVETSPLLGTCYVKIPDVRQIVVFEDTVDGLVAELLLRILQWGRRDFPLPTSADRANDLIKVLDVMVSAFEVEYMHVFANVKIGQRYAWELRARVLSSLNMDATGLGLAFNTVHRWSISQD
jgi:hypothetical protein